MKIENKNFESIDYTLNSEFKIRIVLDTINVIDYHVKYTYDIWSLWMERKHNFLNMNQIKILTYKIHEK